MMSFVNGLKKIMSSIRFKNSGLNLDFNSFSTFSSFSLVTPLSKYSEPILDVIIRIVFLKSTTRPIESVKRPSSSTCNKMLKTSGCAFSISSSKTIE